MMTTKHTLLATTATLLLAFASTAQAAGSDDYLSLNIGQYNALRTTQQAFQFGAEYRFSEYSYGIHPIIGAFGTSDGAAYGYGGFNWSVAILPNQLYIVPNFAVGAYHQGSGRDLGGAIEFRSGIELDYQFANEHQLGIALNHLSNAGIYKKNPGEESIIVTYSIPIKSLF